MRLKDEMEKLIEPDAYNWNLAIRECQRLSDCYLALVEDKLRLQADASGKVKVEDAVRVIQGRF